MRVPASNGDLSVQQIIERVLIRSSQHPHTYSKGPSASLTSQEHLWHYRLQQQNLQLKEKLKNLGLQLKKKVDYKERCNALTKQVHGLRVELEGVGKSNQHLQQEIHQTRLKNSSINDSIQHSLDESLRGRKHNRSCSCVSANNRQNYQQNMQKRDQIRINDSPSSPQREILRTKKDVSVMCLMTWREGVHQPKLAEKQEHLLALKKIVESQEKLLAAYQREIQQKRAKQQQQLFKSKTMQSTDRIKYPFQRTTSHNTFKPLSSAGSIVKVRRG